MREGEGGRGREERERERERRERGMPCNSLTCFDGSGNLASGCFVLSYIQ